MDLNDLRIAVTVVSLLVFVGIVRWALARRNAGRFAEAAWLPFDDEAQAPSQGAQGRSAR
jgi:cytochrome c oxidase cbb3-type subunit 4